MRVVQVWVVWDLLADVAVASCVCVLLLSLSPLSLLSLSHSLPIFLCVSLSRLTPNRRFPAIVNNGQKDSTFGGGSGGLMKCEIKLARRALTAAGWLLHPSPTCMPLLLPLPIDVYMAPPPSSFGYRSLLSRPTRTRFKLIIM